MSLSVMENEIYQYTKSFSHNPGLAAQLIREKIEAFGLASTEKKPLPKQAMLITYGDQISDETNKNAPLKQQHLWLKEHLSKELSAVHLLPFYPYTSDDGFSVQDYTKVHEDMGSWEDIQSMGDDFDLMFDAVVNHCSQKHQWFVDYLAQKDYAQDYFVEHDPKDESLKQVVRPRTSPLLHAYENKAKETKYIWTTFSEDQIDLNFASPHLLAEIVDILLFYIQKGACYIRLDAITFAIKKLGTNCASLPETHQLVKLLRYIAMQVAPHVVIITETNVPHKENISYFGEGDEAQMVYNFALAPLLVHATLRQNASILAAWAKNLEAAPKDCSYFNMTAVHDGIGVRGATEELGLEEIDYMAKTCLERGGQIQYRCADDGTKTPYELCITFFDMLNPKEERDTAQSIERFMLTQYFAMTLKGVPGIYFHNLLASSSWQKGFEQTQRGRSLNRQKLTQAELNQLIKNDTKSKIVFERMKQALKLYHEIDELGPYGEQEVVEVSSQVIKIKRSDDFMAYFNFSAGHHNIDLARPMEDYLTGYIYETSLTLSPWQSMWLRAL